MSIEIMKRNILVSLVALDFKAEAALYHLYTLFYKYTINSRISWVWYISSTGSCCSQ